MARSLGWARVVCELTVCLAYEADGADCRMCPCTRLPRVAGLPCASCHHPALPLLPSQAWHGRAVPGQEAHGRPETVDKCVKGRSAAKLLEGATRHGIKLARLRCDRGEPDICRVMT